MKNILFIVILLNYLPLYAQSDSVQLDSKFHFKNGIYSSYIEVLNNNPKYPDFLLETRRSSEVIFGGSDYIFYNKLLNKQPYTDPLFAFVDDGVLLVYYKKDFHKLILTGAISTFFTEMTTHFSNGYTTTDANLYFLDLITGNIDKLNPENIDSIIKRDSRFYTDYSSISYSDKKKILYSYVLKYNKRNPIYIKLE
jgi:hypothetical protein